MLRGMIKFKCDACGHKFVAPDIEYMASAFSTPQPCPQCQSRHTYPARGLFASAGPYRKIWSQIEGNSDEK